ncbi:ORF6C domain-containing protein [Ruoffia sp. FAM 24228]|uniref:ORF6C domain-containing protein n=1 Tax=Ruoffia sp. FAM 24228 TaxID=3259517 RepID=UPI003889ECC1
MNKNEIVGQSKDHTNAITLINSIGQIGEAIQAISTQMTNHEKRLSKVEDTMRVNGIQEMKLTSAVNKRVISWRG